MIILRILRTWVFAFWVFTNQTTLSHSQQIECNGVRKMISKMTQMWRLRSRVTRWTPGNQVLQSHSKMINKCQNHQLFNLPRVNGLKKTDSWCWFLPTDKQNASVIFVCEGWINLPRQWLTFYCVTWTRLCGAVRFKAGIKSLFWQVSSISLVTRMSRILLICYWHNIFKWSRCLVFPVPVFFSQFPCITDRQY